MRLAFYAPLKPASHPVPSGDRRMARRGGLARGIDRIDGNAGEARGRQVHPDPADVMVAMRRARHEARRILWKYSRQRRSHHVGEFALLDAAPDIEKETR